MKPHYYPIAEAAKIISVTEDRLVHFAANGDIRLHVLVPSRYRINPLHLEKYDFFGERPAGLVIGLPVDRPVFLNKEQWRNYEADGGNFFISTLDSGNFPQSEFSTPPSLDFA